MADTSTRLFCASLRGRLYRDIELPSSKSLEDLAAAIVGAFGFDFDHAAGFYSKLTGRYHDADERYELFADHQGRPLITVGDPLPPVRWFAEGRAATREEVLASIASGLPTLEEQCLLEAADQIAFAQQALRKKHEAALVYLPA